MAERDQVLDELARAAEAVAEHDVGLDAGNRAVDQHERDSELREPPQVALRPVADGCDHDPLDPVGDHLLDHLALELEVGARVAEEHAEAGAPRDVLRSADDQREERVRDVRDDQRERARPLPAQPAREAARNVAELGDRLLDAPAGLGADPLAVVDHARDGHRRRRPPAAQRP